MSLSVGIVGLPNVGKSTLFNALMGEARAYAANFPFATVEPNVGEVPVPDSRLSELAVVVKKSEKLSSRPPIVPATVKFIDIAGLVEGAHKGEGLGNKFLAHIREVDVICHTLRVFGDDSVVKEGVVDPESDFVTINTELALADLQTLENVSKKKKFLQENPDLGEFIKIAVDAINSNQALNSVSFTDEQFMEGKKLGLLTLKPILVVLNIDEGDLSEAQDIEKDFAQKLDINASQVVAISAKLEEEMAGLTSHEKLHFLIDAGMEDTGLDRLISRAFETLGLITFLTAGEKEVRAWTIKRGTAAPQAAGTIHGDFEKKFIKVDAIDYEKFVSLGGWNNGRAQGEVRQEGKEYVLKDGDVVEFKVGS